MDMNHIVRNIFRLDNQIFRGLVGAKRLEITEEELWKLYELPECTEHFKS